MDYWDSFYTASLGVTAMDCYLQVPITLRYLRNAEIGKIPKPEEDMAIMIKTLSNKSSQSHPVDTVNDAWEAYKTCAKVIDGYHPLSLLKVYQIIVKFRQHIASRRRVVPFKNHGGWQKQ